MPKPGPAYYERLTPQPIEVIEAWELGFHAGAALKYLARAGYKPGASALEDLRKARWFIDRLIELAEVAPQPRDTLPSARPGDADER